MLTFGKILCLARSSIAVTASLTETASSDKRLTTVSGGHVTKKQKIDNTTVDVVNAKQTKRLMSTKRDKQTVGAK